MGRCGGVSFWGGGDLFLGGSLYGEGGLFVGKWGGGSFQLLCGGGSLCGEVGDLFVISFWRFLNEMKQQICRG